MNDFLDIYTRLKMKTDSNIIVTYYSSYGNKQMKEFKLIDVVGFSYLLLESDNEKVSIPFFGRDTLIESITFKNTDKPIYYNPYLNKNMFDGWYVNSEDLERVKKSFLQNSNLNLEDREKFIQKFKSKESNFDLDELFFSEKQKKEFNDFFAQLIKELTTHCKNNGFDSNLKIIGRGTTSIIYSIGDKIIKIGKNRRQDYIPYCEYLLQPIINKNFEFDGYPIHIEVTQKVIVCEDIKNGWEDEKFVAIRDELAEKLHEIGLKSTDLHPANIGILTSENKIHFDSIYFDTGDQFSTSIQNNNNLRIKGKGEFVIIDLDCLEIEDINKYTEYLRNIGISLQSNDDSIKRR